MQDNNQHEHLEHEPIEDTIAAAVTEPVPDTRAIILELQQSKYEDDNIAALLRERGKSHGEFIDHATVTVTLKQIVRTHCNMNSGVRSYDMLSVIQQESIDMILHKIGRIIAGNPNIADHWDDIAGYAKLVSQRLPK